MKALTFVVTVFLTVALFGAVSVLAQPHLINYQGRLMYGPCWPVIGAVTITFSIYDAPEDGTQLWTETHEVVYVQNGIYNVLLGSVTPIPDGVFDGGDRWLGIQVDPEDEMIPRQQIVSAAYAINSDMLDARHAFEFLSSTHSDTMMACDNDVPMLRVINNCDGGGIEAKTSGGYGGLFTSDSYRGLYAKGGGGYEAAYLDGDVTTKGSMSIEGSTAFNNDTQSTSPTTGAVVVAGGVGIGKNLNVGGSLKVGSSLFYDAKGLVVSGSGGVGPNSDHIAYFENTETGNDDGIAIKLAKSTTDTSNNFVTFYNGNGSAAGCIEGFTWVNPPVSSADLLSGWTPGTSKNWFDIAALVALDLGLGTFTVGPYSIGPYGAKICFLGECGSCDVVPEVTVFPKWTFIDPTTLDDLTWPSFSFSIADVVTATGQQKLRDLMDWAIETDNTDLIAKEPLEIAVAAVLMAEKAILNQGGVTYQSKGADYAEWLPKLDPEENYLPGLIVGVHGGKVSLETEDAEQIMAVSMAPVILGNMPPEGEENTYVKVGFMGQVDVFVRGKVRVGDFIIPSGKNDGRGIAISPDSLKVEHLPHVLGRAWSESSNDYLNLITVAVGLETNVWADMLKKQQERIEELESRVESLCELETRVEELESLMYMMTSDNTAVVVSK